MPRDHCAAATFSAAFQRNGLRTPGWPSQPCSRNARAALNTSCEAAPAGLAANSPHNAAAARLITRRIANSGNQFYALHVRPRRVVFLGIEGHEHEGFITGVLEGVRGAWWEYEAPSLTGRHQDILDALAGAITYQGRSEHRGDFGAAPVPVIAAHCTGLGNHRVYIAPSLQQRRLERFEDRAATIGMYRQLPNLDLKPAHQRQRPYNAVTLLLANWLAFNM